MVANFEAKVTLDQVKRAGRGGKRAGDHVINTDKRIVAQLRDLVALVGQETKNQVLLDMLAPKTGIQYPGRPNQSSAPGEVPAFQTGELWESIVIQANKTGLSVNVDVTAKYAMYLRNGIGGEQNERPILGPAAQRVYKIFMTELKNILENE